jgi:anti-sigma factor RsiW
LSEHLTQTQIDAYGRRKLPAAEALTVIDHLAACDECRLRSEMALNSDAAFFDLRSQVLDGAADARHFSEPWGHLTFEQTAEYVDGILTGEELQSVADHLSCCELCAASVDDLRAFSTQVAPDLNREFQPTPARPAPEGRWRRLLKTVSFFPQRSPAFLFASALAALLLTVAGWLIWQALQRTASIPKAIANLPSPTATPAPALGPFSPAAPLASPEIPASAPSMVIARLNDGGGEVTLDQAGTLSGVENLPPAYQQMIKNALADKRLEKSPLLAGLNRAGSALMSGGDSQNNTFSALEPVGKVTLSDRPTFHWTQLAGATAYVVEVYDEKFNLVATSPQLSADSWTPTQALRRGAIYSWQMKAIKDGQEFISPRPPTPQAKFRVLDQSRALELAQSQRAYASSRLTMGLLYARLGMLEEAERELRALQKANPNSAIARQLLAKIQAMRS